jgi:hypothetical protein
VSPSKGFKSFYRHRGGVTVGDVLDRGGDPFIHPLKVADEHPEWPRWRCGTLVLIKVPYNDETKALFGDEHVIISTIKNGKNGNTRLITGTQEKIEKYWNDHIPEAFQNWFR